MKSMPLALATLGLLGACASPLFDVGKTETVLPLQRAWVDSRIVEYVTTDISDGPMAQMMGANHVPRLADAVRAGAGASVLERVYKFAGDEQISIFQSAPAPVGPGNKDRGYSPLWRVVMVTWIDRSKLRELKSEEALLKAQDQGEVRLDMTDIVVNCPVTRAAGGQALKGVR
jgi:hypothetical protein